MSGLLINPFSFVYLMAFITGLEAPTKSNGTRSHILDKIDVSPIDGCDLCFSTPYVPALPIMIICVRYLVESPVAERVIN